MHADEEASLEAQQTFFISLGFLLRVTGKSTFRLKWVEAFSITKNKVKFNKCHGLPHFCSSSSASITSCNDSK